mmetsp:Transcript_21392/g.45957  ORF Transcript_21392/g.45957 Transcript_21392/m.45957 type:complete len:240 (-) Transcript_21392:318-1037(-)
MGQDLEALEADLVALRHTAQRLTSQRLLDDELQRVRTQQREEGQKRKEKEQRPVQKAPASVPAPIRLSTSKSDSIVTPRIFVPFKSYSWDQGSKWVKVYLTADGLSDLSDEQICTSFSKLSLRVELTGLKSGPPNRRITIPNLGGEVKPEQCTWVRKGSDMMLVKLRKVVEGGDSWPSLDDSAAKKEAEKARRSEQNQGKSTMELLHELYADADEDGKVALSKAWEDGRAKREAKRQPL